MVLRTFAAGRINIFTMTSNKKHTHAGLPNVGINDHDEKPSQTIPSPFLILLLAFYLLVGFVTKIIEDDLPRVVPEGDIKINESNIFSEEHARKYLKQILGDEPRVSGMPYHLAKTRDIKDLVDSIARNANLPVATDWQFASDDYWLDFKVPNVNGYRNISNVIAVLEGDSGFNPDGTTGPSLLVNCHYDSVPFAMGASDNGVFCAAMAEVLYKLSRRKNKFKNNVVFLFNGAEESLLLGSHGFLQHPWSKGVTNVINLDSAGMNGKPIVFQVTDARVFNMYKKSCSKPNAQGIGEVLFDSGVVPSDTDFRIFRDFGHIEGIDVAFIKDGNVYHTRNDITHYIENGVIQNAGNMLLNVIKESADNVELRNKKDQSVGVYYDYVGLFLITYSYLTAFIVDLVVSLLGFASVVFYLWLFGFRKSIIHELIWSVGGRIFCLIAEIITFAIFTYIMVMTTTQMRYLTDNWMVIPLYCIPCLIGGISASHVFDIWRIRKVTLTRSIRCIQSLTATRFILSICLLVLSFIPSLANIRYILTVILLMMSLSSFISMTVVRYWKLSAFQHLTLEIIPTLPATLFGYSLSYRFITFLIPIMGRSGNDLPDVAIATVSAGFTLLVCLSLSGIELLFNRKRLWLVLSTGLLVCIVFMFTPLSPYRGKTVVQRHYWFHTQVTTYNKNLTKTEQISGVLITKVDLYSVEYALDAIKNSPLYINDSDSDKSMTSVKISDSDIKVTTDDECEEFVNCNMPIYKLRFSKFMQGSLFVKMDHPAAFEHSLHLVNKSCVDDNCVLSFRLNGPSQNTITILPRSNISLIKWSFNSPLKETMLHKERPLYVIVQTFGTYSEIFEPLEFVLTFNVPRDLQSHTIVDIFHTANKIYNPEDFTEGYRKLLNVMPEYFNIATFLSFRDNYEF